MICSSLNFCGLMWSRQLVYLLGHGNSRVPAWSRQLVCLLGHDSSCAPVVPTFRIPRWSRHSVYLAGHDSSCTSLDLMICSSLISDQLSDLASPRPAASFFKFQPATAQTLKVPELRSRLNPRSENLAKSQTGYVPDLHPAKSRVIGSQISKSI